MRFHKGFDRAWATILDSNVTTLIVGLALVAFGSGPIKGIRDCALPWYCDLDFLRGIRVAWRG